MGAGSFGSFMDAARSQSRFSAQLAARLELLRIRAKANGGHEGGAVMESFDCFTLCQACHRLGEPHDVCPHCGASEPLDLRSFVYARSYQELEEAQRRRPPWWGKVFGYTTSAVTFVALTWGSMLLSERLGLMGVPFFFASIGILLGVALWFGKWLRKPVVRMLHSARTKAPLRWRREQLASQSEGTEEMLLEAPLTGRPCRGYHVQVDLIDPEAMHDAVWLLDETIALAGPDAQRLMQAIEANKAQGTTPLPNHELKSSLMKREQYLRARGLTQDDGELRFYETIIP